MLEYATNSGWTNTQIELQASGYYTREVARSFDTKKAIGLGFLGLMLLVVIAATVVQTTKIGDKTETEDEVFQSSAQYESNILSRKKVWAQWFSIFSLSRNFNLLNVNPVPYQQAMNEENRDYVRNLRVLNGLKVILSLYALFGSSYFFCYYSIVTDSLQADEFRHSVGFLFVTSALFTTPCLFWLAGFLHTFSFLQIEADK